MRYQGKIDEWHDERGFGFVCSREDGERAFVHISAFPSRSRRPSVGEMISYGMGRDERGRPRAVDVTYIVERRIVRPRRTTSYGSALATLVAGAFLLIVMAAVFVGSLPWQVLGVYVLASVLAYVAYANDKRAAQTGRWRTKEATLLLLGLAGGWPGGLIAQQQFRHKTKKGEFQALFWLTVGLNCAALIWLRTS
jgi:uncharacterized membrane protein YsdA (DUF1294 family)/cold shock CspA family protein